MIFDALANHKLYNSLGHNLPAAFKFLEESDLSALPVGRTDLDGDNMFVLVQEYVTRMPSEGKWEAHRRYIDVQYMYSGRELMGFANLQKMSPGEYLPEKDFQAMADVMPGMGNTVEVGAGQFAVFFPEDAHKPGISAVAVSEPVRKIVVKIKIQG